MLVLVDGNNLVHRNWHVSTLFNPEGHRISGIYGFIRSIRKIMVDNSGSRVLMFWDSRSKRRLGLLQDYKANRKNLRTPEENEDLSMNLSLCREFSEAMGFSNLLVEGVEADDLIARVVLENKETPRKIISTDKDFYQLLIAGGDVCIERYEQEGLLDKYNFLLRKGMSVNQYRIYHVLLGDPGDNVPNVPGVGKTTVLKFVLSLNDDLLEKLGTDKSFFPSLCELARQDSNSRARKLGAVEEKLALNHELVDLLHAEILAPEEITSLKESLNKEVEFDFDSLVTMLASWQFEGLGVEYAIDMDNRIRCRKVAVNA